MEGEQHGRDESTLSLYDHSLIPIVMVEGSVEKWRCTRCGEEHTDAIAYMDVSCQ